VQDDLPPLIAELQRVAPGEAPLMASMTIDRLIINIASSCLLNPHKLSIWVNNKYRE